MGSRRVRSECASGDCWALPPRGPSNADDNRQADRREPAMTMPTMGGKRPENRVSLQLLQRILVDASSAHTVEEQVERLVSQVRDAMAAGACSLYQRFDDTLRMVANCGFAPESVGRIALPMGEGLVGRIARDRMSLNLADASAHPDFRLFPQSGEEAFPAFLGVPIIHLGAVNGVLIVQDDRPSAFSEDEVSFLVTVAAQLGPILLPLRAPASTSGRRLRGRSGSPGKAVGRVHLVLSEQTVQLVEEPQSAGTEEEIGVLETAVSRTREKIGRAKSQLEAHVAPDVLELFDLYNAMLSGDRLVTAAAGRVREGHSAFSAVRATVDETIAAFEAIEDDYLSARAEDVRHVGNKLLVEILGSAMPSPEHAEGVVLLGGSVGIADVGAFRPEQLTGIVCLQGSSYSHTAVLARALGIPAVVGIGPVDHIVEGMPVIVDGDGGEVIFEPPGVLLRAYEELVASERQLQNELLAQKDLPGVTTDGCRITLLANTGLMADVRPGKLRGAEGIGLYRSEIPFLMSPVLPTEAEQYATYRELLEIYHPLPVTIRTVDLGGDKQLPYLPTQEENPALGWRGIRFALDNPAILVSQLRAMLRADHGLGNLQIMLPMISDVSEVQEARRLANTVAAALTAEGLDIRMPPLGVMVEIPAVVDVLPDLAPEIDFACVGSNDLAQYLLAVDRGNPRVVGRYDYLHPGVLGCLDVIARRVEDLGIRLSICGEMAADPVGVVVLLGLGYRALSMNAYSLPRIRALIRGISIREAQALARSALACRNPGSSRVAIAAALAGLGLDHLLAHGGAFESASTPALAGSPSRP